MKKLSIDEMMQINGGFPWGILVPVGIYLYDNRDRFIDGVKDGMK